jgi:magnesium-transporting ATPase (P-type)
MIIEDFDGVGTILRELRTDQKMGIENTKAELANRMKVFGKNSFPPPKIKTIGELIMENFDDQINVILLAAAFVSMIIGYI